MRSSSSARSHQRTTVVSMSIDSGLESRRVGSHRCRASRSPCAARSNSGVVDIGISSRGGLRFLRAGYGADREETGGLFGVAAISVRIEGGGFRGGCWLKEALDEEARLV